MSDIPGLKFIRMDYSTNPPSGVFEVDESQCKMITLDDTGEILYAEPTLEEQARQLTSQTITKAKGE